MPLSSWWTGTAPSVFGGSSAAASVSGHTSRTGTTRTSRSRSRARSASRGRRGLPTNRGTFTTPTRMGSLGDRVRSASEAVRLRKKYRTPSQRAWDATTAGLSLVWTVTETAGSFVWWAATFIQHTVAWLGSTVGTFRGKMAESRSRSSRSSRTTEDQSYYTDTNDNEPRDRSEKRNHSGYNQYSRNGQTAGTIPGPSLRQSTGNDANTRGSMSQQNGRQGPSSRFGVRQHKPWP